MKSYLSLIPISAKVHRRQNRMTLLCIIIAVFLVTAIFSMVQMWTDSEVEAMRQKHGDWHIVLQNIPEKAGDQIRQRSDILYSSWYEDLNTTGDEGYSINGKNTALYGVEESYMADIWKYPVEGNYPRGEKEAALSADAKELLGIRIGDQIVLQTPGGNLEYMVSGFYEDDSEFNDIMDGCCVYMNPSGFGSVTSINPGDVSPRFYIRFQKETGLRKTIGDLKQEYNLTDENVKENTAILALLGASSSTTDGLYPLAALCFVIILAAGIFMIASCMNSNVAQRTAFFGMLRCIGASKKQIIRFVRLEALNWCKTAVPLGCLLGVVSCWILCVILRFFVKGEFTNMPLFSVSIPGILWGAAVGIITVFLAAHFPAKQAAKVSPMAAVSGNTENTRKIRHAANTRLFKVETSLGMKHAAESQKNLLLMTGSFALMIVLFLAFSACLDLVHKLLPSVSDFTPDLMIASQDNTNSIDQELTKEISKISGVDSVSGIMYRTACPVEINEQSSAIDLFSYDDTMMKEFKNSVVSGDLEKVYGNSGYAASVYNQDNRLNVGDKIKIGEEELEIACVMSEGVGSISGSPIVVCSEETFTRITGDQNYGMVNVVLEKEASETAVNRIKDLAVGMSVGQVTKMITAEAVTYAVWGVVAGSALGLLLHYVIYKKIIITHFGGGWSFPLVPMAVIIGLISCVLAVYAPAKRMKNISVTETINEL